MSEPVTKWPRSDDDRPEGVWVYHTAQGDHIVGGWQWLSGWPKFVSAEEGIIFGDDTFEPGESFTRLPAWDEIAAMQRRIVELEEEVPEAMRHTRYLMSSAGIDNAHMASDDVIDWLNELVRVREEHAEVLALLTADDALCRLGFVEAFRQLKAQADAALCGGRSE